MNTPTDNLIEYTKPKRMLLRRLEDWIQACWATYAMLLQTRVVPDTTFIWARTMVGEQVRQNRNIGQLQEERRVTRNLKDE